MDKNSIIKTAKKRESLVLDFHALCNTNHTVEKLFYREGF